MKAIHSDIIRWVLVALFAVVGGWAAASGFMVLALDLTAHFPEHGQEQIPFHFFPPLFVAPTRIYPVVACGILVVCFVSVYLLRKHKLRSRDSFS